MMPVPPGVHRADLGDDSIAALCTSRGTWQWLNRTTDRIWAAAANGTVPDLVAELKADRLKDAETLVATTIDGLIRAGLLGPGAGTGRLPQQIPAATTVAEPAARPSLFMRLPAWVGLALALALMRLPLHTRMRALGLLRFLPAAPPRLAASAAATVLRVRPGWWPGRIACMEVSLATVLTLALCGRRAPWVLGARRLPSEAHAWVWTPAGALGLSGRDADDPRRPWVGVAAAPAIRLQE
ncbi:lasso peptide biosynthesis B2 protein [Streptomyces sp. NPDC001698]|uniref:lasso peptide biosynthesis B2 protein n=1 Tax=Streptomyces sp. NPDC001698 TaxID=3364601 RepID=UPI0036CEFD2C